MKKYYTAISRTAHTCKNMVESQKHYAKWKKPDIKKNQIHCMIPFRACWKRQNRNQVSGTRGWRWERGLTANGHEKTFGVGENILYLYYGGGYTFIKFMEPKKGNFHCTKSIARSLIFFFLNTAKTKEKWQTGKNIHS